MIDVMIIGGGAAGLMAAIRAAELGAKVCILEQNPKLGKKLYATGNGKCNFTNLMMRRECYHGDPLLLDLIFSRFTCQNTLDFFQKIGVFYKDKNGYVYPCSEQAATVVKKLSEEAIRRGVTIRCDSKVLDLIQVQEGYQVCLADGSTLEALSLILATGLLAAPKLGSDGSLLPILEKLGYELEPPVPSLCGFYCKGAKFKDIAGVRIQGTVKLVVNGACADKDTGELQLTEYGISGIPVFQVSATASKALAKGQRVEAELCFLPQISEDEMIQYLSAYAAHAQGECSYEQLLNCLLPDKLSMELLRRCQLVPDEIVEMAQIAPLVAAIKHFQLKVTKPREFQYAQVCAGGLKATCINPETLASKLHPGLFFCGELCDVDGICGGYNLQWAWSSGFVAGEEVCRYLRII